MEASVKVEALTYISGGSSVWTEKQCQLRAEAKCPIKFLKNKAYNWDNSCINSDEWNHNTTQKSKRLSEYLCHFLVNGAVCVEAHKALNEKKLSKQFNICSQCWHEVTPLAQLPFLFCTRHNYDIFTPSDDVYQSQSGRPRRWVSTTAGSDCVWSSHLSNQLSPPGRSMLNKPPEESVFVLKGSANRDPKRPLLN